jgi:hypothetical protein
VALTAALVGLAILAFGSQALALGGRGPGHVGNHPVFRLGAPSVGKRTTPALIIGTGHTYDGWVSIDAYGYRPPAGSAGDPDQVCTWIQTDGVPRSVYGSCFSPAPPRRTIAIESAPQLVSPIRPRSSFFAGSLLPDVARVVITIRRGGGQAPQRLAARVARVSGALSRRLGQRRSFGYFFAKFRGRVALADVTATAYDRDGKVLASTTRPHAETGQVRRRRTLGCVS